MDLSGYDVIEKRPTVIQRYQNLELWDTLNGELLQEWCKLPDKIALGPYGSWGDCSIVPEFKKRCRIEKFKEIDGIVGLSITGMPGVYISAKGFSYFSVLLTLLPQRVILLNPSLTFNDPELLSPFGCLPFKDSEAPKMFETFKCVKCVVVAHFFLAYIVENDAGRRFLVKQAGCTADF